jgi:hypothetical protein
MLADADQRVDAWRWMTRCLRAQRDIDAPSGRPPGPVTGVRAAFSLGCWLLLRRHRLRPGMMVIARADQVGGRD